MIFRRFFLRRVVGDELRSFVPFVPVHRFRLAKKWREGSRDDDDDSVSRRGVRDRSRVERVRRARDFDGRVWRNSRERLDGAEKRVVGDASADARADQPAETFLARD